MRTLVTWHYFSKYLWRSRHMVWKLVTWIYYPSCIPCCAALQEQPLQSTICSRSIRWEEAITALVDVAKMNWGKLMTVSWHSLLWDVLCGCRFVTMEPLSGQRLRRRMCSIHWQLLLGARQLLPWNTFTALVFILRYPSHIHTLHFKHEPTLASGP